MKIAVSTRAEGRRGVSGEWLHALEPLLPSGSLLTDEEDLLPYECDGLTAYRRLPLAVAIPQTVPQVQAVLRHCQARGIPVVARGAGTGLSGGALPHEQGVLLSMARFNRILEVDAGNRIARVQPGVPNLAISQAAAPYGLYYAPDPSSQIACSIGGNVAENAGGVHCLKYGLTVHNVQRLEIVLADGELVTAGGAALDAPGYDLMALLTGSEGMLGVITEITVKLLPKPQYAQALLASFASVEHAGEAVAAIIAQGIIPAGLEMMDQPAARAAEAFVHAGYDTEAAALLLCELDGTPEEVAEDVQRVSGILQTSGAIRLRRSESEAERLLLWSGRKAAFPAVGRLSPDYYCMDGTIPRRRLGEVLRRIGEMSREAGLPVANVFHAGDGNLHPLILYDANQPGALERTEALGERILELCVEVGGTVTGEHGVGVEKLNPMCTQFTAPELAMFHAVKTAFDPKGILNPGKAVPTLHRCAEFGRMHVHGGRLSHPELSRF